MIAFALESAKTEIKARVSTTCWSCLERATFDLIIFVFSFEDASVLTFPFPEKDVLSQKKFIKLKTSAFFL